MNEWTFAEEIKSWWDAAIEASLSGLSNGLRSNRTPIPVGVGLVLSDLHGDEVLLL